MIASDWKLTLDPAGTPLVLLDYGEMLEAELEFSGRRGVTLTPLVRSADPRMRDGKNLSVTFAFRVYRPADTWPLARAAAMATALAALEKTKAPLRIEAAGLGGYTTYAECLVSDASGAIDEDEGRWHITNYALVCTKRTVTPPPPEYPDLVISGITDPTAANGTVIYAGMHLGYPTWSTDGNPITTDPLGSGVVVVYRTVGGWYVFREGPSYYFGKSSAAETPVGLTDWEAMIGEGEPTITVAP